MEHLESVSCWGCSVCFYETDIKSVAISGSRLEEGEQQEAKIERRREEEQASIGLKYRAIIFLLSPLSSLNGHR